MITLENNDVVANFVDFYKEEPPSKHVRTEDGRATYLSRNYFGSLQGSKLVPMLSDFDCAAPFLDNDYGHVWPIQSHCFRAPEVLLGCPWTYSVDIWNLGLLVSQTLSYRALCSKFLNDGTHINRCGISWRTLPYSTGRLVKMARTTMHTSTSPKWLLSWETRLTTSS